ncbi:MucR family transcriptional regulator [Methylobacterium sp. J-070]|uniref:MucR family transcriptional regulator n=1 Tax=Methylobacterium sp. J-070 TaxID=2836650 RepID=UPI001FBB447C|nr:MucR family transcriptional regulator [Methylobacterium sp. J-070]MCJ2053001.1 MucR family transcriptional regulator [Methylobacterium sp. J-070]
MPRSTADAATAGRPSHSDPNYRLLAAEIVSAYVSNNSVSVPDLPGVIGRVHAALTQLGSQTVDQSREPHVERLTNGRIRKSVRPDGIVSFIDGKTYKTLKRHLTSHGLDPKAYRDRYGLPADYPMVAASYAAQRSALAKAIGLGRGEAPPRPRSPRRRKAA